MRFCQPEDLLRLTCTNSTRPVNRCKTEFSRLPQFFTPYFLPQEYIKWTDILNEWYRSISKDLWIKYNCQLETKISQTVIYEVARYLWLSYYSREDFFFFHTTPVYQTRRLEQIPHNKFLGKNFLLCLLFQLICS